MAIRTTPLWYADAGIPRFDGLAGDARADVVVVGAGITGLTTALLCAQAGASVVVLERDRIGAGDTGHTSAHLTMVLDESLTSLVQRFGREHGRAAWDAGVAAIADIERIVGEEAIECDFAIVDGYRHLPVDATNETTKTLNDEAALAQELGFDCELVGAAPLVGRPAIRFPGQARIHPRRYLAGLVTALTRLGVAIHEESGADEFLSEPKGVVARGHRVHCDLVVVATHNPLLGARGVAAATLSQTKLALFSSYVLSAAVPKGTCPDALLWDTASPYHFYRLIQANDHDLVIYGGEDHKTGQASSPLECFATLESHLHRIVPTSKVQHRWSGQVIETNDGLPFIGLQADAEFAATGFAGNGLTLGTVAAMMARDHWTRTKNPWSALFDPTRKVGVGQAWDYVKENADYPFYMARDLLVGPEAQTLRGIGRGQGKVVKYHNQVVAASRDDKGRLVLRSAVCTHMGCVVSWNDAERTWDCPCHGSRFKADGDVIAGPAESPLPPVE